MTVCYAGNMSLTLRQRLQCVFKTDYEVCVCNPHWFLLNAVSEPAILQSDRLVYLWSLLCCFCITTVINPRHAYAVIVTVFAVCVCVCVHLSAFPLNHNSPLRLHFVVKMLPRTQCARKVKIFVVFSLKLLRCRDRALLFLDGHAYGWPFFLWV